MHIIIPMSGIGKRFVDAGYSEQKPLIIVENKPIIEHVINLFPTETKFTFICNDLHLKETNMKQILTNIIPNCNIFEVSVENRKGPVDAVLQASSLIEDDEEIMISYCDYGTKWDYLKFKEELKITKTDGGIACYKGFHPHMLGTDNYAFVKETNMIMEKIQEKKPFTNNKMDEWASNGTYYFKSGLIVKKYFQKLVDLNISINNEFYVSMVYNLMQEDGLKTLIYPIEKMLQWGTPKDLEEYLVWSNYFLKRNVDFNKNFKDLNETTLILPMAGAGSRFFTQGYKDPKPLLNIEGLPMVIQAVKCLPETSNKIFICQNEHLAKYEIDKTIKQFFPDSKLLGIDYVTEGQACTCEIAFKNYQIDNNNPIMISACDNGVYYDINEYQKLLIDDSVDMIIWSFSNNPTSKLYPQMYAWLDVDSNNFIRRVSIKKPFTDCENKYAIIGTMLFKKASIFNEGLKLIYKDNLRTNGEFYVDNLIEPLIKKGYKAKIFDVTNYLCWGTPNDYRTYNYWYEYFYSIFNINQLNE
jgi:NDP-sugar pyrophosphorylase family protein